MRTFLIVLIVLSYTKLSYGQSSIEKFSIDSGGASTTTGNIEIIYTIGEVAVAERSTSGLSVSEGFIDSSNFGATLGINDIEETSIVIYPNPASEEINIKTTFIIDSIEIYNSTGKKVISDKGITKIKVGHLASGIYFLKLKQGHSVINRKVIVAK